jgi:hypothetical protein
MCMIIGYTQLDILSEYSCSGGKARNLLQTPRVIPHQYSRTSHKAGGWPFFGLCDDFGTQQSGSIFPISSARPMRPSPASSSPTFFSHPAFNSSYCWAWSSVSPARRMSLADKPFGECVVHLTKTVLYVLDHSGWCLFFLDSFATASMKDQAFWNVLKRISLCKPSPEGVRVHRPFGARSCSRFEARLASFTGVPSAKRGVACIEATDIVRVCRTDFEDGTRRGGGLERRRLCEKRGVRFAMV